MTIGVTTENVPNVLLRFHTLCVSQCSFLIIGVLRKVETCFHVSRDFVTFTDCNYKLRHTQDKQKCHDHKVL